MDGSSKSRGDKPDLINTSYKSNVCFCSHIHTSQLSVTVYHGSNRRKLESDLWETDIVLTTYETLRQEWIAKGPLYFGTWHRIVLDEGENPSTSHFFTYWLWLKHIIFATDLPNYLKRSRPSIQNFGGASPELQFTILLMTTEHYWVSFAFHSWWRSLNLTFG